MRVVVLSGGRSSEHEVSLRSGAAIGAGLRAAGHDVLDVRLAADGRWLGPDGEALALTPAGGLLGADVVLPALHGPFGEDGTVQGLLELLDVPYVGAGVLGSSLCMDKVVFKDVMAAAGIPQVDYVGVPEGRWRSAPEAELARLAPLGGPVFVKPARLGSSVGIARVGGAPGEPTLAEALDAAFAHDSRVIVEAGSPGLEIECAVMDTTDGPRASTPGEIVLTGGGWYDYAAKYTPGGMELVVPARLRSEVLEAVRSLAVEAFERSGCNGLARVDFFVEAGERVLVNELNTLPGFTETSVYPKLWEASGVAFGPLLDTLLAAAVARFERERGSHAF